MPKVLTPRRKQRVVPKKPRKSVRQGLVRTFRAANGYLDALVNNERLLRPEYKSNNFNLARMSKLASAMGNPQTQFRTVHIAGTKGKGSTAAMVAAMLNSCQHKVGLYMSPHVLDIRERIILNGQMIGHTAFTEAIDAVASTVKRAKLPEPTYFEALTAAAFYYFAEHGVDVAVVETGLGGRLDATSIIAPEVVGITSISYDHMAQLGSDLESIAREKAGVFKKGVPVISAPQRPPVRAVLEEVAASVGAPIRFANEDVDFSYRFEFSRTHGRHARICLTTPTSRFEHVHVPLLGEHQAVNCAVALSLVDTLKQQGFAIDDQQAVAGLANVNLLGRMQTICENPRVLVDGAHNAASIDALMRAIGQNIPYDSMVVIFGCKKDKDISGMIRRIQVGADKLIFTSVDSPRTADPNELAAEYVERSQKMAQVAPNLETAMQLAQSAIGRDDLICITGSFCLVAEALRKYWKKVS